MKVRMVTAASQLEDAVRRFMHQADSSAITLLSRLGEECITRVRDRSFAESWNDQTGALRSSVGYAVLHNGRIVIDGGFDKVKDGAEGVAEGRVMVQKLAELFNRGYVLVVVAGMHYAEYVEAMTDKDVLASTELFARQEAPKVMARLARQVFKIL